MPSHLRKQLINLEIALLLEEWDKALSISEKITTNLDQMFKDLTLEEIEAIFNLLDYLKNLLITKSKFLTASQKSLKVSQNYLKY